MDQSIKLKIWNRNTPKKKTGKDLLNTSLGKDCLDMTLKAQTEEKSESMSNLNTSAQQNKQLSKLKGNLQNWREFLQIMHWTRG